MVHSIFPWLQFKGAGGKRGKLQEKGAKIERGKRKRKREKGNREREREREKKMKRERLRE